MPQLIEPGLGGVNTTIEIIRTYFGHKIKRYILGQTLSSETDATGLGSGVADAHMATLADILNYDAINQSETLTVDVLRPMQLWNFPKSAHISLKLVVDTESDNVRERLDSISKAYEMGLQVKADEVYKIVGMARPDAEDEILRSPKIYPPAGMMPGGMPMPGGAMPGQSPAGNHPLAAPAVYATPEAFAQSFGAGLKSRGLVL
jgi:phage gp29-like protein